MKINDMDDITTRQAAKILVVSVRRMQALIKAGHFKTVRVSECGCCFMVSRKEVYRVKREIEKFKNKRRER